MYPSQKQGVIFTKFVYFATFLRKIPGGRRTFCFLLSSARPSSARFKQQMDKIGKLRFGALFSAAGAYLLPGRSYRRCRATATI
jgi:hypothetical protein